MRRTLFTVVLSCLVLLSRTEAAVSVGTNGSVKWTFDTAPAATDWSTLSVGTGSSVITTPAQLDAAVELLSAASITNALPVSATYPPIEGALARWNSIRQLLESRPAGNSFTVLMATLRNDSGKSQPWLTVIYDLVAVTNQLSGSEPVPGHRVYFSRTGAAGSWQNIPALSVSVSGPAAAGFNLNWPPGAKLYLLWADDNATTETDGAYTIDNFVVRTITVDGPSLEILSPVTGAVGQEGTAMPISAYAQFFGTMTNCAFLVDGQAVSIDSTPRFGTTAGGSYVHPTAGLRRLTAVARNSAGQSLTSAVVQVTITNQPSPGPKLTINLANESVARVTWPLSSTGYVLQAASSLPASWVEVEEPDNQFGGLHHIYVSVLDPVLFFRLWKP